MEDTKQTVINKLNELYNDEKSKNFVLHLVRSYLPLDKPKKVFTKPENMKKFRCALTSYNLISVDEVFAIMQSQEYQDGFMEDLKYNAGLALGEKEADPNHEPLLRKMTKNRIIGYQGSETSTYLCQDAIEGLFNWVTNKMMENDGKINWTIRQMQTKQFTDKFKGSKDEKTKKQVSRIDKISRQPKRAKVKLGDFDALQELKEKLKKMENE